MGKITKFAKGQAKKAPMMPPAKAPKAAMPAAIPPPQSESEAPDAAPMAPPMQGASSTPKMVGGDMGSGLSMRKAIKRGSY